MKIAFLRHGPTAWNEAGRIQGHTDIPLSEAGLAKMTGLRLPFTFPRVYSSPLIRARQTAKALGLDNLLLDNRLREQHWGDWEGLSRDEILARHGTDAFLKVGSARGGDFRPLGGESTSELHARVAAFLKDVATDEGNAIVVAHLGVVRAAYTLASGWAMDTPMPPELDISKILLLSLNAAGVPRIEKLNIDFVAQDGHSPLA